MARKLTAQEKVKKARANLVMSQPFFGALALRLTMVEDDKVKDTSCNGVEIRYNPKWIDELTVDEVNGEIAHAVMGPALLHHTRRQGRSHEKWNQASDYAIDQILNEAGFTVKQAKIDPAYKGKTVEEIFKLLPDQPNGGGEDGEGNSHGEVADSPGNSQSERNAYEQEWKIAVAQAAHVAKQAGKLPASMDRLLNDLFQAVLPWKAIMKRFMTEKANDDFSWKRGNRRFIAQGLYLPSRVSDDAAGTMVVAIDTSGSIGEKELQEFGNEVNGIHKEVKPKKLIVIYCDASVNKVVEFGPEDDVKLEMVGGGGTDFRPPFDYIQEHGIEPKCFVYLTDGYGAFPEQEAWFPVMWAITSEVVPPWGEHLLLQV